ncbi:hypothetical protein N9B73_08930 [Verrucomicrobiales bacterium]|nr:hypothetical protein [Verrucomicrobiales bacterium]
MSEISLAAAPFLALVWMEITAIACGGRCPVSKNETTIITTFVMLITGRYLILIHGL